jgi:beta-1,4-mannosyl-glycoprotein beta-1,4-N-acetylglucosaminyltransferase
MFFFCLVLLDRAHYGRQQKIFDAFTFNGEWDMLEIRVKTLAKVVDHFVIVESNLTFSGRPKPLFLTENIKFIKNFGVSFRICFVRLHANAASSWNNEATTRQTVLRNIGDAAGDDWIMFSDLDERPRPDLVARLPGMRNESSVGFPCRDHYYNFRWKVSEGSPDRGAPAPVAVRKSRITSVNTLWRAATYSFPLRSCWHCSYCFGPSMYDFVTKFINKVTSFSHTEFSTGKYIDPTYIETCHEEGVSPFTGTKFQIEHGLDTPPIVSEEPRFRYLLGDRVVRLKNCVASNNNSSLPNQ